LGFSIVGAMVVKKTMLTVGIIAAVLGGGYILSSVDMRSDEEILTACLRQESSVTMEQCKAIGRQIQEEFYTGVFGNEVGGRFIAEERRRSGD
jgi:hypothetical protein